MNCPSSGVQQRSHAGTASSLITAISYVVRLFTSSADTLHREKFQNPSLGFFLTKSNPGIECLAWEYRKKHPAIWPPGWEWPKNHAGLSNKNHVEAMNKNELNMVFVRQTQHGF